MKLFKVTEKNGASITYQSEVELDWTALGHGFPERPELNEMGEPTGAILPAEYTIEIEDITAQVEQEKINAEALAYLAATDWMVLRAMDNGTPVPQEIKDLRQAARDKVVR